MTDNNEKSAVNGNDDGRQQSPPEVMDEDLEILEMTERTLEVPGSRDEETIDLDELMDDEDGLDIIDLTDEADGGDDVLDLTEVDDDTDEDIVELTEEVSGDDDIVDLTDEVSGQDEDVLELRDEVGTDEDVVELTEEVGADSEDILELTDAVDEDEPLELTEAVGEEEEPLELTEAVGEEDEPLELTEAVSEEDEVLDLTEAAGEEEEDVLDLTDAMAAEDDDIEVTEEPAGVEDEVFDLTDVFDDMDAQAAEAGEKSGFSEATVDEEELNLASSTVETPADSLVDDELLELTDDVAMVGDEDELLKMTETSELSVEDLAFVDQAGDFAAEDGGTPEVSTITGADSAEEDILDLTDESLFAEAAETEAAAADVETGWTEGDELEFSDTVEMSEIEPAEGPLEADPESSEAEPQTEAAGEFSESLNEELETALDTSDEAAAEIDPHTARKVSARVHNRREIEIPSDFNSETIHAWHESLKQQMAEAGMDSISEKHLENALARAIKETYAEKLEQMIAGAVEKAIQQEIEKLSRLVGGDE